MLVTKSIESIEEVWNEHSVTHEEQLMQPIAENIKQEEKVEHNEAAKFYVTWSGYISLPPQHLIEEAYGLLNEAYLQNFYDARDEMVKQTVEMAYEEGLNVSKGS
jgi:hypothetical protein